MARPCWASLRELSVRQYPLLYWRIESSQITDNDGEALFKVEPSEGTVFVFVNGSIAYKGYLREKIVAYV